MRGWRGAHTNTNREARQPDSVAGARAAAAATVGKSAHIEPSQRGCVINSLDTHHWVVFAPLPNQLGEEGLHFMLARLSDRDRDLSCFLAHFSHAYASRAAPSTV